MGRGHEALEKTNFEIIKESFVPRDSFARLMTGRTKGSQFAAVSKNRG